MESCPTFSTFEYTDVEYGEIGSKEKERADPEKSKLYLSRNSIEYLEKLNIAQILRNRIKFQNYVGVVSFKNLRLEILPKFLRTEERLAKHEDISDRKTVLSNLTKMLEYSGWEGIKSVYLTRLGIENDFFEIYAYLFAKNLSSLLKTRRDASYIRKYDALRFVKGRIDFRYLNPASLHIVSCHYHERCMDTTISRTLKYVSYLLVKKIRNAETRRLLNKIVSMLDSVTLAPVTLSEIDRVVFNRLNSAFKPYMDFCRAFLQRSILSMQGSDVEFFSFLIPMEVLFERFIAKAVKEIVGEDEYKIETQKMSGYLARSDGRRMFALKPDIVLIKDKSKIIIDTKYKLLNPEERKLGISQQDLYQIYAYCRELDSRECVLLYPEGVNGSIEQEFELGIGKENKGQEKIDLRVRTISLENPFEGGKLSREFIKTLRNAIGLS